MSRISLYEETEGPKPNIHYVIDVLANKKGDGSCAVDATEFECEEALSCYCRSLKDIILGEIHIIESRGSGVDRILKAFARLYLLAELELIEKKLDPESRCLLLRALKSMKGVDEMISRLMGDEESVVESMIVSEMPSGAELEAAVVTSVSEPIPSTSASADV
ncbi:hypothetical protein ElyMa_000138800 [Elysia marginata]|uniref:Uncharacterized protein n=1 Tax=Elysia marginata TaxID=1093978 RepID=A0AAV4EPY4_9GAST|nr:hypothetical protein ElyMa_000138800 [Elysia marginata]